MSEVFLKIVNMSISASYLVAAVLLLRLILKKAPKWVSVLLWGFVAVRLICPFSIESALSLIPSSEPVPEQVIAELRVDILTEAPQINAPVADRTDTPVHDETGVQNPGDTTVPEAKGIPVVTVLTAVWLAGVAGMLVYTAVSYFLLRQKVATAVRLRNNIYQSENVDSPFVLGVVGPKIYLPFRMDGQNLAHVIAHEEAHIRRKDHWWKPFGFVLLAIHWFNPLMWVGYILLCRDIELACDEKVIKEMDNKTKADYTQALVDCSVNRRSIAACPLAFGEVGVKERVKTVMNYKKPAFWIVIAAVALCIVVAVSFLTNPKEKDYGPEVGNPNMLEFPGVEWFVTPEELKEALNITEDQILDEYTDLPAEDEAHWDRYVLSVTDLVLYGREVTYAHFEFERTPGYDFAFQSATVMFAEDTDMEQLKDDLVEIYGTGGEDLSYYLYEDNVKRNYNIKLRMEQNLEYLSMHSFFSQGLDGNPYQEALNDPDYMVHHWATENGCSFLPEEVVEWFKYVMDQSWNVYDSVLQDDEVLMEMLDQLPWVAMTLSNRNVTTIRRDAQGIENELAAYYTNNYMEFSAAWLADYVHAARETKQEDTATATNPTDNTIVATEPPVAPATLAEILASVPVVDDQSMLCFPDIKWGATPDAIKDVLALSEEQILADKPFGDGYILSVTGVPFFGGEVVCGEFKFSARNDEYGLASITLYYPDDTDMAAVKDALVDIYGMPNDGEGFTRYKVSNGALEADTDWGYSADFSNEETFVMGWWESTAKRADVLPVEVQETMIESGYLTYYVERLDPTDPSSRELILEYLENDPAVLLYCTNGSSMGNSGSPYYTKNVVSFNALEYMIQLLYNSK